MSEAVAIDGPLWVWHEHESDCLGCGVDGTWQAVFRKVVGGVEYGVLAVFTNRRADPPSESQMGMMEVEAMRGFAMVAVNSGA